MSRALTSAALGAVQAETVARTLAVRLDFDSGVVLVNASPASIWIGGEEYLGVGSLGSISTIAEGAELRPYGLRLTLAGIPRDVFSIALAERYKDRAAKIYEVVFDPATGQVVADPIVVFAGRMDTMDLSLGQTATCLLTLESRLADWERPRIRRYTDEDQRAAYPNDRAFRFVAATVEKDIVWPARTFRA